MVGAAGKMTLGQVAETVFLFLKILLIGFVLPWVLSVINLILIIVAVLKASENKLYRYPINWRIVQ